MLERIYNNTFAICSLVKFTDKFYFPSIIFRLFCIVSVVFLGAGHSGYAQSGCTPPAGVKINTVLARKMVLAWDSASIGPGNKVRVAYSVYPGNNFIYREFDAHSGGELTGLKPATQYLVRVDKLCGGQYSAAISLGTLRTLSITEEQALCDPALTGDICHVLKETATGFRGNNFIEIVFPKPPVEWLAQYPNHQITVQYRPLDASGSPVGNWQDKSAMYADLPGGILRITGLTINTMYELKATWVVQNSNGGSVRTCQIPLVNTPTLGETFAGPVFKKYPPEITLDCNTPEPLPIPQPPYSGGCTSPLLTYTDEPVGSGCSRYVVRTWLAVDNCGRTARATQTIYFQDVQAPTFVDVPASYAALECGENLPTEEPTAVDNCSAVTLALAEQTQGSGCDQTITRTWTARDACGNTATYVQTIVISENIEENNGEDPQVPPLPVNCGQNYTPQPITNQQPLNNAQPGDVFNIAGFPVLLKEVSGSGGSFSGLAKVRLPFGNKVVYVDFNNISVNTDRRIFQGELIAVPDPNFVMPDPGNLDIGGDICIPEPPLAAVGFNEHGEYVLQPPYDGWQPGDPVNPNYDPNGFDANGYHIGTGTQFNESGCNQQGLDKDGNPCNPGTQGPYYWLHNNNSNNPDAPTTPEGLAFATEVQPNIRSKVEAAINTLLTQNTANITSQRNLCGTIRTDLDTKSAGLDRKYLFGANNEFYAEDMNLNFSSKPLALQMNIPGRSQQFIDIENKHIDLYYCDKLLYKFKQISLILQGFKSSAGLDIMVAKVLDAIKRLDAAKVNELKNDPAKLMAWLLEFIDDELQNELHNRGLVYQEPGHLPDYMAQPAIETGTPEQTNASAYQYLAAAGDERDEMLQLAVAQSFELTPADLKFQYYQGWEYVGNTSRAFFLEALVNARQTRKNYVLTEGEDPESLLPIKIEKEVGGRTYTILLDQIRFSTTGGTLDAYFILEVPNSGQKVVFRATDIPFSAGGLGGATTKLRLDSDVSIRLNNTAKLIIKGSSGNTFVNWNCSGFAGMGIQAEIEFCRNYFIPLVPATLEEDPDQDKRVKAYFTASMPAWGEFIAHLTMDPFALAKHPDFKWEVQNAWLDFSDVENPTNFVNIAANYHSEFKNGSGFSNQWKGFFMERLSVTLPKKFNKNSATPFKIQAEKLVIDDRGLTGLVSFIGPIIPLSEGNLDGWAFSMDRITVAVVANRIQGGGFGGLINVPIFGAANSQPGANDCFKYDAKIIATAAGELFEFSVQPAGSLDVNIWVGKATLKPTSFLRVTYANDEFTILANLCGSVNVDGDLGADVNFKLPSLDFENVQLSNRPPYFKGGSFGVPLSLGANIGGFGLTIQGPTLGSANDQCTMTIGAAIKLVGDKADDQENKLDIGASTKVLLYGEMILINGRQRWRFKDFEIKKIHLNASWKGVDGVTGDLEFYKNDPVFGKGFRGQVAVKFSGLKLGDLGVEALAQFGSFGDYKYFLVDALVKLGNGIPMGGLSLKGFGGGAYYHMNRDSTAFKGIDQAPGSFNMPNGLGVSMSGIKYTPSSLIGLGLKAMVVVATEGNEEIFNAGASFEIRFNSKENGGGIKDIALYGSARLMAPIQFGISSLYSSTPTQAAPVSANLAITYDFSTKTLHGELVVYANVENAFVGAGPNDQVGHAVIHFEPGKWYINVGTPSAPTGIKFRIPVGRSDGLDLFVVKSYLCIGTGIPPMPPLPAYVRQMTGASNFMADESRRATGRGFAFGASVTLSTGEMKFLIFYAQLEAGLGFDVMVQKYQGITCSNNGGKPLGVNGWYASGQAWAYIDADVGLKFRGNKYTILNIGAAAALQVKLPNPFWARGSVGGKYKLLGGLIKGTCNFKFTLGKSCDTDGDGDAVEYVKLIEELDPYDNADGVEVSGKPVAYFGVPMNGSFTLSDEEGNEKEYTTQLISAKLTKNGVIVPGNLVYSPDKRQMTYQVPNFLEGNTTYRFEVSVKCMHNGQQIRQETKVSEFTTGDPMALIPPSNVEVSYPLDGMYNFYRAESNQGYIKLIDGQPDLLREAKLQARFFTKNGKVAQATATATADGRKISFEIPTANLPQNQFYRMDMVKVFDMQAEQEEQGAGSAKGPNASAGKSSVGDPLPIQENIAVLYSLYFRTSVFAKFADKITQFKNANTASNHQTTMILTGTLEPFDQVEIYGTAQVSPLIHSTTGTSAHIEYLKSIYTSFQNFGFKPLNRPTSDDGDLMPQEFLRVAVNGEEGTSFRANIETFEAGGSGVTSATVALKNILFTMGRADLGDFAWQSLLAVQDDCSWCLPYDGSDPYPDDCDQYAYDHSTGPWPPVRCCCSSTYWSLMVDPELWNIFMGVFPKPPVNTNHPAYLKYRLPDGAYSTDNLDLVFKIVTAF